jgi:hypothetical protein
MLREGEHLGELTEIVAMQDEIERDGSAPGSEPIKYAKLLPVGFGATDFVGGVLAGPLKTELEMIESSCEKRIQA